MKETIIFSYTGQFALLRLMAKYGVNNVGYRVFSNKSILSYIREKTGNLTSKKMVDNREKAYLFTNFLEESQSYFKGGSYENAKGLSEIIDSVRVLITDDEDNQMKEKLQGSKKYEAIYEFYKKYIDYLNTNNRTDTIEEARDIIKLNPKIDIEVIVFKGEELPPLYRRLLETCFKSVREIEFRELLNKTKQEKIEIKHLYKSKGYTHEVSNVFKIIVDKKLPIDTCTIVYTNQNNFYNSIKEYSNLLSFPVTYIDGIPSTEYNAYRMLYLITKLNDGLYGYNVLVDLLKDKTFNFAKLISDIGLQDDEELFLEEIGDLKFTFDPNYNDMIFSNYIKYNSNHKEEIKNFKDIFNKGVINLIKEYVIVDDFSITDRLIKDLELYRSINNKDDFEFFHSISNVLINGSEEKAGSITACSISKAKENIRENMFFVGNDADSFHISLAENSYIADDKLEEFDKDNAKTSIKKAIHKRDLYKESIQLSYDFGSNVYISYSEKDETELKNHNLISVLYELQKTSNTNLTFDEFKNMFEPVNAYYGNLFRKEEKIIEKYLDKTNYIVGEPIETEKEELIKDLTQKKYSPTQIEQNLNCKKRFLIESILKIKPEDNYDVFKKLDNTDLGDMFHKVMQEVNKGKSEKEINDIANNIFESVCSKRNPVLNYELDKDKQEFLKMVKNGYTYLKNKPKGIAENKLTQDIDVNGNKLHIVGTPDLVAGNEIIDYKAKRSITHKEEDPLSCIQALIYALMNSDKNIDHVEYYYPLFKRIIKTKNNEKNTIALLNDFYNSIANCYYPAAFELLDPKKDKDKLKEICEFCKFSDICGKDK